jgi:glycosyltransferase involved in cell wall biosynthesis
VIAGDGPMASELRDKVQTMQLANVSLCGVQPPDQIRRLYQEADLFLFPSQWEGSPRVILEAAACGLPVIARDRYHVETVVDGQTGYLVQSDEQLFQRLEQLLASPDLRRSMGEQGRRHIQQFDWDRIAGQWEEIFLQLAASGRRGTAE